MINISSQNRQRLEYLFSTKYYQYQTKKQRDRRGSIKRRMSFVAGLNRAVTYNNNNDSNANGIKQEFQTYFNDNAKNRNSATENDLIKWLLNKILTSMDFSFREIRMLMNDSFLRFKAQTNNYF